MTQHGGSPLTDMQQRLDEMLAGVAEQQRGLDRVRQSLDTAEQSGTSADHAVTVTVGSRGDVLKVRFHGTRYRTMPAAQLERTIVETVAAARALMTTRVTEAFQPYVPSGSGLAALMAGDDSGDAFGALRIPEAGRG